LCTLLVSFCLLLAADLARGDDAPTFVGADGCVCHKNPERGDQYHKWLKDDPHARSYVTLASDKAKAIAKEMGIENAQKSEKCLKCHSTAATLKPEQLSGTMPVEEGISCEGCHGAGSNFKKLNIMSNYALAISNGLIPLKKPEERKALCGQCHNKDMPKAVYKEIDLVKSWKGKIEHPLIREKDE
jgi:hypothetical protein